MPSRTIAVGWSTRFLVWSFGVVALLLVAFTFFALHTTPAARARTFPASTLFPVAHAAAVDYFLKIDGVDGESSGGTHQNEIDIQSFSWGMSQAGSMSTGGGGGAGKVSMQDFHFSKRIDKSSPLLFNSVAKGKHFASAVITARGTDGRDFMVIKLSDVLVSSFVESDGGGDVPSDQVTLNFTKLEYEYRPVGGAAVKAGWDLKANK